MNQIIFPDEMVIEDKQLYGMLYRGKWVPIIKAPQQYIYATIHIHKHNIIILYGYATGVVPEPTHKLSANQTMMLSKLGMLSYGMSITKTDIKRILKKYSL